MKKAICAEIPADLFEKLTALLKKTGITKKFFIAEAIEEKIRNEKEKRAN